MDIKIINKFILLVPISLIFLMIGCARDVVETKCTGGIIESALPKLANPLNAATITIMREKDYDTIGWAVVELDGNIIATLCSDEQIKFKVDPGNYQLAVKNYPLEEFIQLAVKPKQSVAYKVVLECT